VRISLAVTRIEPIGIKVKTARLVEEILQTEFSKQPLFHLVERDRLDELLKEQELQLSGITSTDSATLAGNLLKVEKVLFGSIALYEGGYVKYLISLRLVDVEKGAVEVAESSQIRSDAELSEAIARIVQKLSDRIEITGKITRIDGQNVYVSLGEDSGTKIGEELSVVRTELIRDDAGSIIMREEKPVANLSVEVVSPEGSRCRIVESAFSLETNMTVRKGRIELERKETTCTLEVKSIPENSRVFLNSDFIGVTPMKLTGLKPGIYRVEIRSGAGYKPYLGRIKPRFILVFSWKWSMKAEAILWQSALPPMFRL